MRRLTVFLFWLPLFVSWLLMTVEGPILSAVVNRLPNEVEMLAALGIVLTLAVTIESPIINLLATATALVRDRRSFMLMRRFTLHWMAGLTVGASLIAFSPLFDLLVIDILGTPVGIATWVRPGLAIMVGWSAAIAWRRFLQGVMIHSGNTREIARGTAIRLIATVAISSGFAQWSSLPGIYVASFGLMSGVVTEAIYATWAVRPALARLPGHELSPPLTYRQLLSFHLPLAATSVLTLVSQPMVTLVLARLDHPTLTLAAWPLVFHATLAMRAPALALPEVVIALFERRGAAEALRSFSLVLTALSLVGMIVFAGTSLASLYLVGLQDATPEVANEARFGLLLFIPLPALATLIAWLRGLLIKNHRTAAVNNGMMLQMASTIALLALGLVQRWPGMVTASVAINTAMTLQLVYLFSISVGERSMSTPEKHLRKTA